MHVTMGDEKNADHKAIHITRWLQEASVPLIQIKEFACHSHLFPVV